MIPEWLPPEYRQAWRALGDYEEVGLQDALEAAQRLRMLRCHRRRINHVYQYEMREVDDGGE